MTTTNRKGNREAQVDRHKEVDNNYKKTTKQKLEGRHPTRKSIQGILRIFHHNAVRVSVNVGRPLTRDQHCEASD